MNFDRVVNICPMNPSGVQLAMAMVPPGTHTRSSSFATRSGRGANMAPIRLVTTSKLASSNGSASASASSKRAFRPSARARARARSTKFPAMSTPVTSTPSLAASNPS